MRSVYKKVFTALDFMGTDDMLMEDQDHFSGRQTGKENRMTLNRTSMDLLGQLHTIWEDYREFISIWETHREDGEKGVLPDGKRIIPEK